MDTNLRRSKKVRAFCYRMLAVGALLTAIAVAIMGREALVDVSDSEGSLKSVSGDLYDLAEFREYINALYNNAMIGYAGIGDDNGYPLTDANANRYAQEALREFRTMVQRRDEDIVYYVKKADGTEYGAVYYPLFSEYDGHLLLPEGLRLCCYWDGENGVLHYFDEGTYEGASYLPMEQYDTAQYKPNKDEAAGLQLVIAVKEEHSYYMLQELDQKAGYYHDIMILLGVVLVIWIIFGICSLFSGKAARQAKADYARISAKLWFEMKLIVLGLLLYFAYVCGLLDFESQLLMRIPLYNSMWLYFPLACALYLFYVDLEQNREAVFVNSLPVKLVAYVKEFVQGVPWYRRAMSWSLFMLFGSVMLLVSGLFFLFSWYTDEWRVPGIAMLLVSALLFYGFCRQKRFLRDTASVVHKLSEMKAGHGNVPLVLSKKSLLGAAAKDLNELEDGIENAVEQQNRSNRMKVELLTNVSHDLKTPLTSIVNYADLLCEEELPETAAEYATALQQKAYRLKKMVQDVFDLSKATSGNLVVEKAVIDLVKLIKQTLADMDERIVESNLTFKLNIATEPLLIEADGEKLYRVFQNLFVNALQYSLENSRVYVQLTEENGFAVARVKNTSHTELNFDTTEIVERFVRADSSRTAEGSGLGLSIVQSFTEACGGQFMVETDADLFTACVRFPLTEGQMLVEET